ncbi:hypothetical protein EPUS_05059 [Endocarpon pusillum Z07020]|uniref:Aconitase/3-isopropylmalate dehydratase large subunit alpha/beta/alpha domain-containing protein n=1 Tax=Endocarpon pusillum (strain Z07020 / HMAS-L-300199) TaxID=1263415 RepID=U1GL79_ENDPU|nr:uncharacterized protein EPUS_05059 [Endocarpon pusillum Z07020]ERF72978.1 hypothetical protein EPUS_05059 [Endocarpon pusillum Z07020]
MCVASDSHSNHYGGIGCLGSPLVRTDAASIWATSRTWWQIPPVARVNFVGTLPPGVTAEDIAVALNIFFKSDVPNHAVEFTGSEETMASLPVDSRLTIANMTTEMTALRFVSFSLSGLFPVDKTLERWLRNKATEATILDDRTTRLRITHEKIDELFANPLTADRDAVYAKQLYLNLDTLAPYVSGPDSVKVGTPLHELAPQHIKINRVQLYIAAASAPEQEAAEAVGDWQTLLDAGAQALPAGCGPCIGLVQACWLEQGRVGHRDAQTYLASPQVVAASALKGVISGPDTYEVPTNWSGVEYGYGTSAEPTTETKLSNFVQQMESLIEQVESIETPRSEVDILPGFPEKISGEIIFCDADNLNTDGIYPGKCTYQDNFSKEDMARVCMENYDP